jgi:hypothetical protein
MKMFRMTELDSKTHLPGDKDMVLFADHDVIVGLMQKHIDAVSTRYETLREACIEIRRQPLSIVNRCRICGSEADITAGDRITHARNCVLISEPDSHFAEIKHAFLAMRDGKENSRSNLYKVLATAFPDTSEGGK